METIKLNVEKFNQEFVANLSRQIHSFLAIKNTVYIALSGGKSPIAWLELLSKEDLDWSRVIVSLVDDRFTENLADRNDKLLEQHLLINNAKLCRLIPLVDENKTLSQCVDQANLLNIDFDIVVLGMGNDSHTASIFPCCAELDTALSADNINDYIATNPTTAAYARIGFTLNKILASGLIILPLNDSAKLQVFNNSATKLEKNKPISYVALKANKLLIYTV